VLCRGPFTAAQAAAAGISRSALRSNIWRKLLRNVWVHVDVPDSPELRIAALSLVVGPGAFICGPTAAWVHGIDVQGPDGELVWLGYRSTARPRQRPGSTIRQVAVTDDELTVVGGVLMTNPLRTAFDCARWLPVIEGVVVADALAHSGAIRLADLAELVSTNRGLRGINNADEVIDFADAGSESPMESRCRVLLVRGGLPRPETQVEIFDQAGSFVARADLAYRLARLAVEYDGAWHFEQRRHDDRRRDAMRAAGWTVIVISAVDYYQHPAEVVAKVRAALALAA
jgi:hypothetical protein